MVLVDETASFSMGVPFLMRADVLIVVVAIFEAIIISSSFGVDVVLNKNKRVGRRRWKEVTYKMAVPSNSSI